MLQVLGRLHPVLVHFPIALLLAALVLELFRPRRDGPNEAGFACLVLGTLGALAAAGSGWLFAAHDSPGMPDVLFRHRWSGVGAAAGACATLLSAWRWRRGAGAARPTRLGLVLTAALVGFSGHLGGTMVYGEGFALEPLRAKPAKPVPAPPPVAPETETAAPVVTEAVAAAPEPEPSASLGPPPVDYWSDVQPILARRCYECHGDRKRPKGHLKLSDLASVFARDASEAAIVPGDPEASSVYQRIVLPPEDLDVMPPEDAPLPAEEIETLRRWIAEGARWSQREGAAPEAEAVAPDDAREPEEARSSVRLDEAQRAARDAALARLRARGAHARRLSGLDEGVEVDLGVAAPRAGDADLALLAGLEPCLVELSLARTAVTDAGLARLADFQALERLRLDHTAAGDRALASLVGLPALASLDLFATEVGAGALPALEAMPALARLYAGDTALAPALDALARARPELAIERGAAPGPVR